MNYALPGVIKSSKPKKNDVKQSQTSSNLFPSLNGKKPKRKITRQEKADKRTEAAVLMTLVGAESPAARVAKKKTVTNLQKISSILSSLCEDDMDVQEDERQQNLSHLAVLVNDYPTLPYAKRKALLPQRPPSMHPHIQFRLATQGDGGFSPSGSRPGSSQRIPTTNLITHTIEELEVKRKVNYETKHEKDEQFCAMQAEKLEAKMAAAELHTLLYEEERRKKAAERKRTWKTIIKVYRIARGFGALWKDHKSLLYIRNVATPCWKRCVAVAKRKRARAELNAAKIGSMKKPTVPSLAKHNFFGILPPMVLGNMIESLEPCCYSKGEFIMMQGDWGTQMYLMDTGKVDIIIYIRGGPPILPEHQQQVTLGDVLTTSNSTGRATTPSTTGSESTEGEDGVPQKAPKTKPAAVAPVRTLSAKSKLRGKVVATLGDGAYFGEFALLSAEGRTASIRCVEDCNCWVLPSAVFWDEVQKMRQPHLVTELVQLGDKRRAANMKTVYPPLTTYFEQFPPFSKFSSDTLQAIKADMVPVPLHDNDVVISKGTVGDPACMYLLVRGTVEMRSRTKRGHKVVRTYTKGEWFGEAQAFFVTPSDYDFVVTCKSDAWRLNRQALLDRMLLQPDAWLDAQQYINRVRATLLAPLSLPTLVACEWVEKTWLSEEERIAVANTMRKHLVPQVLNTSDSLVVGGAPITTIYFIVRGTLEGQNSTKELVGSGTWIGIDRLMSGEAVWECTFKAKSQVSAWELDLQVAGKQILEMHPPIDAKRLSFLDRQRMLQAKRKENSQL
eukprot:TRINITY_DN64612_c0_g1_i1.p1 TRINITY_DN64612_c0_g1~~TRINITY_DN64612_c0_g1_i1.p1  ORF type:complete len:785 (+),score=78.60 TRINITY_DN64612_c0_g1_i1:109-2463(+)